MRTWYSFVMSCFLLGAATAQTPSEAIFVLTRDAEGFAIQRIVVRENQEVILPAEAVSPILPIGLGQSADIVRSEDAPGTIVVRNSEGALEVSYHRQDGSVKKYPPVSFSSLRSYDIRVNVTEGSGVKAVFEINGYESVAETGGPVLDLFKGMIPLAEKDVSTTLVTTRRTPRSAAAVGEFPVSYADELLFTQVRDASGEFVDFIVDFGAGRTVVSKEFLPSGAVIRELVAIERSEKGDRVVKGTMGAAGGEVEAYLGQSTLEEFALGNVHISKLDVNVVRDIPSFGGRKIGGIIGMDILQSGGLIEFSYAEAGFARLGRGESPSEPDISVPFTTAGAHLFIEGALGSIPASFLFDTGARFSIVSESIPGRIGAALFEDSSRTIRGLDGRPIEAKITAPVPVVTAGQPIGSLPFIVADLPVLRSMGLETEGAILGNDVWSKFRRIQVDFEKKSLYLWQ